MYFYPVSKFNNSVFFSLRFVFLILYVAAVCCVHFDFSSKILFTLTHSVQLICITFFNDWCDAQIARLWTQYNILAIHRTLINVDADNRVSLTRSHKQLNIYWICFKLVYINLIGLLTQHKIDIHWMRRVRVCTSLWVGVCKQF